VVDRYTIERLVQCGVDDKRLGERNLSEIDLSQKILLGIDLKGFAVAKANLEHVDFSGSDLRGIQFSGANCVAAIFVGADLRGADLAYGFFHNADFRGADLRGSRLAEAVCNECNFAGADLRGAVFGTEHYDSDFRGADLRGAIIPANCSFDKLNCDMRGAQLTPMDAIRESNKRKTQRAKLVVPLNVVDRRNNQIVGTLLDISVTGLRLSGLYPNPIDAVFPLDILLGEWKTYDQAIHVDVRSVWCKKLVNSEYFQTGFQIINITNEGVRAIESLVDIQKSKKLEITDQLAG
jgi:uncharacterized protein YjbI with pentapeptide repeats